MVILKNEAGFSFCLFREFKGEFLTPMIDNLKEKFILEFDDYNEVYHCNQLIHQLKLNPDVNVDYHIMYNQDHVCVGLAMISHGLIDSDYMFGQSLFKPTNQALVLNYFHISSLARGQGTKWLKDIILPYYQDKEVMYVKSSHPKAFSLYKRLGKEIGTYQSVSDNHDYQRLGKIFEIRMKG